MRYLILILSSFFLMQCNWELIQIAAPDDFIYHPPDTIAPPPPVDSIQLPLADTCVSLEHLQDTAFTLVTLFFINGKPDNTVYNYGSDGAMNQVQMESLAGLFEFFYPQYTYTTYESEFSVTVIVDGVKDNSLFQAKFWARDNIGQKALATAYAQAFYPYGSMTYEEAIYEASHRLNVTSFHYTNTFWTPEQNDTFGRTIMHFDLCKHGEYRADFRKAVGISQSVVDSSVLYLWELPLQFTGKTKA